MKLKLIDAPSENPVLFTVTAVPDAVAFVTLTVGVPVTVKLVLRPLFQTVAGLTTVMIPALPKASVLTLVLLLLNVVAVRVTPLRSNVPRVTTKAFVAVNAPISRKVPPGASAVMGNVIVLPALSKSIVARPENVCVDVPLIVTPEPSLYDP